MRYRKQCEKDYKRYDELRPTIEQVASRFDKLQHEMARLKNGSSEYQTHYRKVIEEYRKLVNIGYFEKRREYNECSQRNWFDEIFSYHTHLIRFRFNRHLNINLYREWL